MKKSTIFIVLALLCLIFKARAQDSTSNPLTGKSRTAVQLELYTKLDEHFWNAEHKFYQNGKQFKNNLSNAKNKVLILDFWATWCANCLKKLPLLDSLQKLYPNELAVIPVNCVTYSDKLERIDAVFKGHNSTNQPFSLPSILEDSNLHALFPHSYISHIIWIQDGQIFGISGSDFLTKEFIEQRVAKQRKSNAFEQSRKK